MPALSLWSGAKDDVPITTATLDAMGWSNKLALSLWKHVQVNHGTGRPRPYPRYDLYLPPNVIAQLRAAGTLRKEVPETVDNDKRFDDQYEGNYLAWNQMLNAVEDPRPSPISHYAIEKPAPPAPVSTAPTLATRSPGFRRPIVDMRRYRVVLGVSRGQSDN